MALHIVQQQPNPLVQMGVNLLGGLLTDAIKRNQEAERNKKMNTARAQAISDITASKAPTTNYLGGLTDLTDTPEGYNDNPWAAAAHKNYTPLTQFDMGTAQFLPQTVNPPQQRVQMLPTQQDAMNAVANVLGQKRWAGVNPEEMYKLMTPYYQQVQNNYDLQRRENAANSIMNAQNSGEQYNQILGSLVNGSLPPEVANQAWNMYQYNNPYAQPYLHNTGQETFFGGFNPRTGQFTQQGSYQNTMSPQEQAQNKYNYDKLVQDDRHWVGDNQIKREELTQRGSQWQSDYELRKRQTDIDEAMQNRKQTFLEETTKWEQAFKEKGALTEQNKIILEGYKQQLGSLDNQIAEQVERLSEEDAPEAKTLINQKIIALQQRRNQVLSELNALGQSLMGVKSEQPTQPTQPQDKQNIQSERENQANTTAPIPKTITQAEFEDLVKKAENGQIEGVVNRDNVKQMLEQQGIKIEPEKIAVIPGVEEMPDPEQMDYYSPKGGYYPNFFDTPEQNKKINSGDFNIENEEWYKKWNKGELPLTSTANSNNGIKIGNAALKYQNNQRVDVIPPYREENTARNIIGGENILSRGFRNYKGLVERTASKYKVDPELISAIIQTESAWNSNAVSKAGARGLMQLMPKTAQGLGVRNSFDPAQNIEGGTKYIAQMLRMFNGDIKKALWAYNAGPGNAKKGRLPKETRAYIPKVMGIYKRLKQNRG